MTVCAPLVSISPCSCSYLSMRFLSSWRNVFATGGERRYASSLLPEEKPKKNHCLLLLRCQASAISLGIWLKSIASPVYSTPLFLPRFSFLPDSKKIFNKCAIFCLAREGVRKTPSLWLGVSAQFLYCHQTMVSMTDCNQLMM